MILQTKCAASGIPWTVEISNDEDRPIVKFYDLRYTKGFTPQGQFVADYYVKTLLEDPGYGLNLNCGVPAWSICAETMDLIKTWLRANI